MHSMYLFRLRTKFNTDIDAIPAPADQNGISDSSLILDGRKIRVLKFYLPSGILETLITNDFETDRENFRMCYFLRWPVMPISALQTLNKIAARWLIEITMHPHFLYKKQW